MTITEIYSWLDDLNRKYPPFEADKWIPPSVRYSHLSLRELWVHSS